MRRIVLLPLGLVVACTGADKDGDTGSVGGGVPVDADGDGFTVDEGDCDDTDAAVNPGAVEVCNEVDDDCDDAVDEDVTDTFFADADGDGYGDPDAATEACDAPADHVSSGTDCDDTDAEVFPSAAERCNGVDDDCDGDIDEDVQSTWYADVDGDGFGDPEVSTADCDPPSGFVADATDCDDTEAEDFPGATEVCDERDNDCDNTVDEGVTTPYWADVDGDGFGDIGTETEACTEPSGFASEAGDCDDADFDIHPDATEVCDGVDNDCDGDVDDADSSVDLSTGGTWYTDADGDGYGAAATATTVCDQPTGTVSDATDCDDTDGAVNPAASEVCNGVDDDCDGDTDDADSSLDLSTGSTWYTDSDGDGYGDASAAVTACDQPTGTVTDDTDCDDTEALAYTGATEACDDVDNDCDGRVDERVCLDVSNVDPSLLDEATTAVTLSSSTTIDTDTGAISGVRAAGTGDVSGIWFEVETQSSGPDLGVFVVDGLTIPSGVTLTVQGSNGLVLLSGDDVDIAGSIDADGDAGTDGRTTTGPRAGGAGTAGGASGGNGSNNATSGATAGSGTGAGGRASAGDHYGNGGGGGGHCGGGGGGMGDKPSTAGTAGSASGGGAGGFVSGSWGRGGDGGGVYGASSLSPLTAGSGGGGGISDTDYNPNGSGGGGGGGGGAVQITVDGTLTVSGAVSADGGAGGDAYGGGGGGGGGGALLLEALELDLSGTVSAAGGSGGDGNLLWVPTGTTGGSAGGLTIVGGGGGATESGGGGGGSGWLHLRYLDSLGTTGVFTPALTSACGGTDTM